MVSRFSNLAEAGVGRLLSVVGVVRRLHSGLHISFRVTFCAGPRQRVEVFCENRRLKWRSVKLGTLYTFKFAGWIQSEGVIIRREQRTYCNDITGHVKKPEVVEINRFPKLRVEYCCRDRKTTGSNISKLLVHSPKAKKMTYLFFRGSIRQLPAARTTPHSTEGSSSARLQGPTTSNACVVR